MFVTSSKAVNLLNTKNRFSIFTDDLEHCYYTKKPHPHIHHIFFGPNRNLAEEDGFIIPLAPELHNMSYGGVHYKRSWDLDLKQRCQRYWEEHMGTREEFISRYGRGYL